MATLNHSTIIKGFEKLAEERNPARFFFDFLKVLKFSAATIKRLQEANSNRNIAKAPGDYGLAKQIYFHHAKDGEDLRGAIAALVSSSDLQKHQIRFFLTTNFVDVVAYDKRVDDWTSFAFKDLRENYEFFLPLTGLYEKPLAYTSHPADVKACEKMGRLYDIIRTLNHYDASNIHELNVFLTRLLFCFFAEDTGIFPKTGQMTAAIESLTQADGSDLSNFFSRLFAILDANPESPVRQNETATLTAFPYVNGGLFRETCRVPTLNAKARTLLLECGKLEWNQISPVIFGSMFQSVMDPEARHELGAHYTSERNILRVIEPLFLSGLKAELAKLLSDQSTHRIKRLKAFHEKLATMKFLDPACGCGNFLIVAYREIKKLELEVVKFIFTDELLDRSVLDDWTTRISRVSINQFYGIEIEEFPVDIARVSMWLMEHVMNRQFSECFGQSFPSIPLRDAANIVKADALEISWNDICSIDQLHFIFGNPPYAGYQVMTGKQKEQISTIFSDQTYSKSLDLVSGWIRKASAYISKNNNLKCAFVCTNSICQGEQVAPIWSSVYTNNCDIEFAHTTFKWFNEAKNNAAVYCVIIGLAHKHFIKRRWLFSYSDISGNPEMRQAESISPYLIEGRSIFVWQRKYPLSRGIQNLVLGNMPKDGGNLILTPEELEGIKSLQEINQYIYHLIGASELLHSKQRYCLWLDGLSLEQALALPTIGDRVARCAAFRQASKAESTRAFSKIAHLFTQRTQPVGSSCIVIPRVSSERREYIPMGFVEGHTIVSDSCHIVPNGTLYDFGILESRMHMTWMRTTCGRLKSDYRYSRDLCYNTFPWPIVSEKQRELITNLANNILMTREFYPDMTLADLYDPDKMPADLRKAHAELDLAVDKLYRGTPFENDEARLRHLFTRYEKLIEAEANAKPSEE